jgi:hypothetical protein
MGEQLELVKVAVSKEIDGVDMGVLSDGTAYLSGRGVARLCGVAVSTIINQADQWAQGKRDNKFAKLLISQGYSEAQLFIPIRGQGGTLHAFPETVVMTFLDYYAFESPTRSDTAQANFRTLGRGGLRVFVYQATGYDPTQLVPTVWREFHDRLLLHSVPTGYFSVFKESADFVMASIRRGLPSNESNVPDISIGISWAKHWRDEGLEGDHGPALKHDHNYPDYFPQAASNPQEIWVYPVAALGVFRIWMDTVYIPTKFGAYLEGKVNRGVLPASTAELLLQEVQPKQLP